METTELLKNVQRVALECMIGKKPVHITIGIMPETNILQVIVQNMTHDVVYMELLNDWVPDYANRNRDAYTRFEKIVNHIIR